MISEWISDHLGLVMAATLSAMIALSGLSVFQYMQDDANHPRSEWRRVNDGDYYLYPGYREHWHWERKKLTL